MKILSIKDKEIVIFTDGSSRGNPGPGGFGAIAIYPNAYGEICVDELGGGELSTTNNRMELAAVIAGLKNFENYYQNLGEYTFILYIDSAYVMNSAEKWLSGWKKKGWVTAGKEDVKNRDMWEEYDAFVSAHSLKIKWNLLKGHSGIFGNERCDVIATSFADQKPVKLYTGTLAGYESTPEGSDILNLASGNSTGADDTSTSGMKKSSKSSKKSGMPAYSYVSMVNGKILTHKTWTECESEVKGKSSAKFKKVFSRTEEDELIKEFKNSL